MVEIVLYIAISEQGTATDETDTFASGEIVYSWLGIVNAAEGDEITWFLQGLNGIVEGASLISDRNGNGYCYVMIDLSRYDSSSVVGD